MNKFADGNAHFPPDLRLRTFVLWYALTTISIFAVSFLFIALINHFFSGAEGEYQKLVFGLFSVLSLYTSPLLLLLLMKLKFKKLAAALKGVWGHWCSSTDIAVWLVVLLAPSTIALLWFLCGANIYVGRQTFLSMVLALAKFLPGLFIDLLLVLGLLQRRYIEMPLRANLRVITIYWLIVKGSNYLAAFINAALSSWSQSHSLNSAWFLFLDKRFPHPPVQIVTLVVNLVILLFSAYLYKRTRSLTPALVFNILLWFFSGLLGFLPSNWVLL